MPPTPTDAPKIVYLDIEDVIALVSLFAAGPVLDVGLLESAVARPRASVFGDDAYPTLPLKAAALLHSLARNDALVDGNKRLAWLATVVFADLNGWSPTVDDEAAFTLVMDAAQGDLDVAGIAEALNLALR